MKVAFFNTGARYDDPACKLRCMFCEALTEHNIENVSYAPTNMNKLFTVYHTDGRTCSIILPCSVPVLSKLARRKGKSLFRKAIIAIENLVFTLQVVQRLPEDRIGVYVITHLWDYEVPFLNLALRIFRPTIIMWFGGSFRGCAQLSGWRYYILAAVYRFSLRLASLTLISLDIEQEYYLFNVLKLPRNKVTDFKEYIVDDKLFRILDKDASAKIVGFNSAEVNIVMVSRIESTQRIDSCKDYEKDPFTALEIFRRLTQKTSNVKLHVFGRGQGMGEFKRRISLYNLQDKVKMYGFIEREQLPQYYSAADLTLYPHPFITINDGQANHESLLCGTPVIYFKRYPWAKTEQPGGFLIDRDPELGAQQILSRLNSTYLLKKREEAASIPHDFNIEAFGNHMTEILKHLLSSRHDKEIT
jgi:glycosyltransferase involved in cell wall biosynthesis